MSYSKLEEKLNLDAFNELHVAFMEADAGKFEYLFDQKKKRKITFN